MSHSVRNRELLERRSKKSNHLTIMKSALSRVELYPYGCLLDVTKLVMMGSYTEQEKAEAWFKIAKTVEDYSEEMIEQWVKEIDGLLTFVRSSQFHMLLSSVVLITCYNRQVSSQLSSPLSTSNPIRSSNSPPSIRQTLY